MADSRREDECHTDSQNSSEDSVLLDNGGPNPRVLPAVCIFKGISPSGKPHLHATSNETRFDHFVAGSLYCFNLQRLQKLEESTMELKLTQECLKRYVSAVNFSKKLETYVEREISRLDSMHRLELSKNRRLALEYYHKLCKDAKIHLSHWPNLECRTRLLTRSSGHALTVLRRIKQFKYEFLFLRRQILFWLSKIAMVGLRVLANSSFKQLSSTVDVQNFLLGIEEYNHLLSNDLQQLCSAAVYDVEDRDRCPFKKVPLSALTIVEILEMISIERSKLLAKLTHGHFVCEAKAVELQDFLSITRFSWTSEGHLSTQDLLKCTGSVSYGKLQSLIRKYGHKEEEFINQLLSTASVCVFLHHESEVRSRDSETCEDHLPQMNCQCTSAVSKCFICQLSDSSIKAITDGSDDCDFCDESGNHTSQLDDLVVSQDRRALFIESRPTKLRLQLCSIYRDDLWNRFGLKFYDCLQSLKWPYAMGTSIGAACCWSTAVLMGITQHLDNLASKGPFSDVGVCSVRVVSRSLYLSSVLASLDGFHCLMLAVGQADKCKSATIIDGVPSMKTTSLMVQACSVFQHFFSTASHWEDLKPDQARSNSLLVRIEDVFDRFSAFLNYCIYWFTTKVKHFLAGWALSSFFGLSQYELGILMKSINTTLQLMEAMYCQLENVCSNGVIVKRHWDCMERKAGYLQVIEVESWENFKQKFIKMASEFWLEMMPKGRFWKRSRNSGRHPSEPSSYVEHAIIQVLQPVIEGVTQLPAGLQNSILVQAVEIMMDTWSSHILKEEIKFSVIGAYQLQVDFNYVKLWLTSEASTLNTSVQSDLAILDVFRQLNEAVHLLTIQPKKKRKLIGVMENSFEPELESNSSTISDSSTGILSANSSYDGDLDQLNNQFIPNKEQWLNLRLRNGKPKIPLVIPACLKSVEQS